MPKADTFETHVDRDETQLVQFPEAYEPDAGSVKWGTFLRDVFICSLGAYGGPEAHMGVFIDQMVTKKRYLTESELVELMALCSILPGPTSTQTIVSIG